MKHILCIDRKNFLGGTLYGNGSGFGKSAFWHQPHLIGTDSAALLIRLLRRKVARPTTSSGPDGRPWREVPCRHRMLADLSSPPAARRTQLMVPTGWFHDAMVRRLRFWKFPEASQAEALAKVPTMILSERLEAYSFFGSCGGIGLNRRLGAELQHTERLTTC